MENAENGDFEQDKQVISSSYAPLESLVLGLFRSVPLFIPFRSVPFRGLSFKAALLRGCCSGRNSSVWPMRVRPKLKKEKESKHTVVVPLGADSFLCLSGLFRTSCEPFGAVRCRGLR